MKKEFRSIFVVILIFVFALTGCKKTSEELAKEEDIKKGSLYLRQLIQFTELL